MNILHLDSNHPYLLEELKLLGCNNIEDHISSKKTIEKTIDQYDGIVIRSRFEIDPPFIDKAKNLKFIARVGAGLDSIDTSYAKSKNITIIAASEGNANAVAEHALGMLLALFNNLLKAHRQIQEGRWIREANRGIELDGKTVGIIGYGVIGKTFAKKLHSFNIEVLCYDILENVGNQHAKQVSLNELQEKSDVISLHTPHNSLSNKMINTAFIQQCKKPFYLINTARGTAVVINDLAKELKSGKILGACLDVIEFEKKSFETLFKEETTAAFQYLLQSDKVILSPHIAGWTHESKKKLAKVIVEKIKKLFFTPK